ncbi:MAG: hypothetical protein ACYC8T_21105 [Myxococcaceae bacterium]
MRRLVPQKVTSTGVLYVIVVAAYLLAFPYHPGLRSPNELCRLWQTRSLVEYGTLNINGALRDYGYVGDLSVKDGLYYPSKAPLLSFAAVPVYVALKAWDGGNPRAVGEVAWVFWSRLFITVLPTLLMLLFLRRFLVTYLTPQVADPLVATYALGSLAFNYSQMFLSHQTTAVLLFFAFYALWRSGRGDWRKRGYLAAGAFAGAAVACEYTSALAVAGLVVYAAYDFLSKRDAAFRARALRLAQAAGLATLGALPFVIALALYHQACFGGPLTSGYKYLNDPGYQGWHMGGFLGIRYPDPRAFLLSFFSPLRGLFVTSPFLLLGLAGLGRVWKAERALFWLALVQLVGHAYFTSSFNYDSWGWAAAPRHLTGLVPFLLLPAGLALEWARRQTSPARHLLLGVALALCGLSIALTGSIALVNYIPDDLSTSVFGLVWPLFSSGYLPPTTLLFAGIANPWSGGLLWLLIGVAAVMVMAKLLLEGRETKPLAPRLLAPALAACALTVFGTLFVLQYATRHDSADESAVKFMRSIWLAPPGITLTSPGQ